MTFTLLLVLILAAYRITHLVIDDTILDKPRDAFKRRFPPDSEWARWYRAETSSDDPEYVPHKYWALSPSPMPGRRALKWSEGLFCYWCIGFWIAGATTLVVANLTSVPQPVLVWFAVSAAIGLIARNLDG